MSIVGLVAAEAIARANILNTAMVQSQGLTASVDTLLSWIVTAETTLSNMKPVSLNLENLEDQVNEFKVRTDAYIFYMIIFDFNVSQNVLFWNSRHAKSMIANMILTEYSYEFLSLAKQMSRATATVVLKSISPNLR